MLVRVHCACGGVVYGHTILRCYNTYVYSQFSVVSSLYRPPRHPMMQSVSIEQCSRFFRRWRTGLVQKQVVGEASMTPGAVIDCCKGICRCGKYPVFIDLSAEEGKRRNLHFDPPKLGDRPPTTSELIAPWHHSRLCCSRRHYAAVTYYRSRSSSIILDYV